MGSKVGVLKVAAARLGISFDVYVMRTANGEKFCWKCRTWKLKEVFAIDKHRGDGLSAVCHQCCRRPGSSGKKPQPIEKAARGMVRYAIEIGRLAHPTGLPCFLCGKPAREYHHHLGYDRVHWFDVQAICKSCHRTMHPRRR